MIFFFFVVEVLKSLVEEKRNQSPKKTQTLNRLKAFDEEPPNTYVCMYALW
jgi:hypothetical protein